MLTRLLCGSMLMFGNYCTAVTKFVWCRWKCHYLSFVYWTNESFDWMMVPDEKSEVPRVIRIHPMVFEIFQSARKWKTNWPTNQYSNAYIS